MANIILGDKVFCCSDVAFVHLCTVFLEAVAHPEFHMLNSLNIVDEQSLFSFSDAVGEFIDDYISIEECLNYDDSK